MSIRNLSNDQHKEWLDGKFDNLNARQFAFTNGDTAVFANTAVLELGGNAGSIGEILKKDGSNNPAWVAPHIFGEVLHTFTDHEVTPFSTASATFVTASTYTPPALATGTYVLQYQCEIENNTGIAVADFYETTSATAINNWITETVVGDFRCVSGFKVIVIPPITATPTYDFRLRSTAGTSQLRRARLIIYKVL